MKRNIYSYSKLWIIFFVLMGAACTNQVEDVIPVSGQPIEFSVQSDWKEIPNTRSNAGKPQFGNGNPIQIFGFHKSSSGGSEKVQFMYRVGEPARGQIVTFDSIYNKWNYSPKRFWPKKGTLDFYAGYPEYSVLYDKDNPNDKDNHRMTYEQTVNPLQLDLLWGVSTLDCATGPKDVSITMKHALAKVNIKFDNSLDKVKQAKVSAYKIGYFYPTIADSIPNWKVVPDSIQTAFIPSPKNQTEIGDATVFILPDKIKELKLIKLDGSEINVSDQIQKYTFKAGKVYNLTISKGVRKKNTNSRSIAMSVRCVSE